MMDWDKLRIFHRVAEASSFTSAARRLNLSQSAVSRQISGLEESLQVTLFTRHARGLVLTSEGERLYMTVRDVFNQIEAAEREMLEARGTARGPLRITTMVSFGAIWLTPLLKDFIRRYPEIDLELLLSDEEVDLSKGEADVAIRFQPPQHADLIQRPLVKVRQHIYGAPEYLERRGTPQSATDLDRHDLISYGPLPPEAIRDINWVLSAGAAGRARRSVLQVNNIYAVLQAIEAGMGLASIPDYLVATNRRLVRVLPDLEGPAFETYFVYPSELRGSKRVALFRDFLLEQIKTAANIL